MKKYYLIIETSTGKTTSIFNNLEEAKKVYEYYLNKFNYLSISRIMKGAN